MKAALAWFLWPLQAPVQTGAPNLPGLDASKVSLSKSWHILGPFQLGTRESIWGADPLERQGGFRHLKYDPGETFRSALAANGSVSWNIVSAHQLNSSADQARACLNVTFPEIDWEGLQSVYGWPALQYQFWARGSLDLKGAQTQTVAFFGAGLLEFWVDGRLHFGGDMYHYRRAPSILRLSPGRHALDLRLTRDVRAFGALSHGVEVTVDAQLRQQSVTVDQNSLLISELAEGKLGSHWASINVQNNEAGPVAFISIHASRVCHNLSPLFI
ncbi:hypothetical protein N7492_000825 [Penicillium capsulatum]|uniref:Beta-galactosidase n=1 Tax=Penicillium capsulatum TaxID=69766 RepID=A0A9W9IQ98_9EURO|nr:hypothetical protein N7492_000825 [Penicillium capsulatum]KAJ6130116.1 hypothetical protein N7512_002896 [Penicillium capsulatum]